MTGSVELLELASSAKTLYVTKYRYHYLNHVHILKFLWWNFLGYGLLACDTVATDTADGGCMHLQNLCIPPMGLQIVTTQRTMNLTMID